MMAMKSQQSRPSRIRHAVPDSVTFGLYTSEQIRRLSVVKVVTSVCFDSLGNPVSGGLYDTSLGPTKDREDVCKTCHENFFYCPGHMGHIELPLSAINPLFHKTVFQILKITCLNCFILRIPAHYKLLLLTQLKLLDDGYALEAQEAAEVLSSNFPSEMQSLSEEQSEIFAKNVLDEYVESLEREPEIRELKAKFYSKSVLSLRRHFITATLNHVIKGKCRHCKAENKTLTFFQNRIMGLGVRLSTANESSQTESTSAERRNILSGPTCLTPKEIRNVLSKVCREQLTILQELFPLLKHAPPGDPSDIFFIDAVAVSPPKTRPINFINGQSIYHLQTKTYQDVMQSCFVLRNIIQAVKDNSTDNLPYEAKDILEELPGRSLKEKLHTAWQRMQLSVDQLLDTKMGNFYSGQGIKQLIEKKAGLFRMHMMGKRVNFAGRSVITPDPNISIDEIGIPEAFAMKLTYPVAVTSWNVAELRRMVLNGPDVHPGAVMVENEDGRCFYLNSNADNQRESIAKRLLTREEHSTDTFSGVKIVHRHLCNGDVLLLNRQPTLHKPSIMAHKARVLKGEKTIRLHYANCKAYNADFDGDEMNAHFPQNEIARSEAYNLVNVCKQYLVPKDGTPLSGLIQDHIVSGVKLTMRGRFFERDDYNQLVYEALFFLKKPIKLLPPAIWKPVPLWSGKQIISTILINLVPDGRISINLQSKAKISSKAWESQEPRPWKAGGTPFKDDRTMSEAEVIIRQGELLCGVPDKTHYGATSYGLIHCFYELYGGNCSSQLLSSFSRLFTGFLQREGFSLGVEDILVLRGADKERANIKRNARKAGDQAAAGGLGLKSFTNEELREKLEEADSSSDPRRKSNIDRQYKSTMDGFTNSINRACMPSGLLKKFPNNNLQLMVQSGAKGSTVNTMQISCLLGQIELEGKRPPLMISGRALPSFPPYDTSPRAGGFVDGRFMTGIRPQEFFFHCMAGREGLIDTAVKTSRSGYLQRCLIKHLEGLVVNYDMTVRDSDGSVIQFLYGEDGLDVCKAPFLKEKQLNIILENSKGMLSKQKVSTLKNNSDIHGIEAAKSSIRKWKKKHGNPLQKRRVSAFTKYSASMSDVMQEYGNEFIVESGRTELTENIVRMWRESNHHERKWFQKKCTRCPDPVLAQFRPACDFGTLSERLEAVMDNYLKGEMSEAVCSDNDVRRVIQVTKTQFQDLIALKSMESLCRAGEPVGLLAAQSIGEPSTQMTLNTFHFAGRGEMNVTLGIPRLREIIMVASKKINTPSSEIPFLSHISESRKESERIKMKLTRVTVADVLEYVHVKEEIEEKGAFWYLKYAIRFQFLPHKSYKHIFCVRPEDILQYMERTFFKSILMPVFKKHSGLRSADLIEMKGAVPFGVFGKDARPENYNEEYYERKRNGEIEEYDDTGISEDNEDYVEMNTEDQKKDDQNEGGGDDAGMRDLEEMVDHVSAEETDESSDEESEINDDYATMTKQREKHEDYCNYEEPKNDVIKEEASKGSVDMDTDENKSEERNSSSEEDLDTSKGDSDEEDEGYLEILSTIKRMEDVVNLHPYFDSYNYDMREQQWCKLEFSTPVARNTVDMSTLLRECAEKAVIHEISGIKKAFTYINPDTKCLTLKTDGHNLEEMFNFEELLDLNKLYTNDIHKMADIYGIEAARNVLVKEIQDVFKVYGITVDPRHLLLVADYMTYDGTYKPCNRVGLVSCVSPLQQMSFETSLQYLQRATLEGTTDKLQSPSSRIVVGLPCRSGTGAFDVVQDIQLYKLNS